MDDKKFCFEFSLNDLEHAIHIHDMIRCHDEDIEDLYSQLDGLRKIYLDILDQLKEIKNKN